MILAVGLIPAPASVQITDITIEMNYKMVMASTLMLQIDDGLLSLKGSRIR